MAGITTITISPIFVTRDLLILNKMNGIQTESGVTEIKLNILNEESCYWGGSSSISK